MKKRIGTKLYDTDTAILVVPELNLYRTQKKQTYFYYDGEVITPIEYQEAEKVITKSNNINAINMLGRRGDRRGNSKIEISALAADRLAAYCRASGKTQKEVIEEFINSL